jgi:flagellar protein FlaJ
MALVIIGLDVGFFVGEPLFPFLLGVAVVVAVLPFLTGLMNESRIERERGERFLEFTRSLAESVKAGTPIGKSIINMSGKDFGTLSPYIRKLANQISLGIPIGRCLETFANDVDSVIVRRAVTLIREAESAGGDINHILDSTAEAIYQIEKLKRERKSAVSSLVVEGYIIFFIFVGIMLVMQFKILPLTAGVGSITSIGSIDTSTGGVTTATVEATKDLARPFLYLLLVQGFFTGLTIGKISEGSIRAGLKHSIILTLLAFLITSGANVFL